MCRDPEASSGRNYRKKRRILCYRRFQQTKHPQQSDLTLRALYWAISFSHPDRSLLIPLPEIHGTTIEEQAEQVMKNIGELLKAAGTGYTRVAKTSCFLADMGDFAAFNQVYAKYFTENPARSCVAVKTLPKNVLCEVEVIAEV